MTAHHPLPPLLPTRHHSPGERLLHGKGIAAAVGAGRAEDWLRLDRDVWSCTWGVRSRMRSTLSVGFHTFDAREVADWRRSPHWHEADAAAGTPAGVWWPAPPGESELAIALCHDDPRVRAAALDHAEGGAPPAAVLPLVLVRCTDTDETVRERARSVAGRALTDADEDALRALAPLALVLGLRRHGAWVRDAVLARIGGAPAEAVAELWASRRPEFRIAALRAAAAAGRLTAAEAYDLAEGDPDTGVRVQALRMALGMVAEAERAGGGGPASGDRPAGEGGLADREADGSAGGDGDIEDPLERFHVFLEDCRDASLRHAALAAAQEAGALRAGDLARLALTHRDAVLRRRAVEALTADGAGDPHLDRLVAARDAVVRAAAVARLRAAGRGDELKRHLTDPYARVRAVACREFRAAGGEPRSAYRTACADPATVTPGAVSGLAEQGGPEDLPLLRSLARHPSGAVRARALAALRMRGALPGDGPEPFAADPDPVVRATALSALRDRPEALRRILSLPYEDVRAEALSQLADRHGLGWREALPFLDDPSPRVVRVAGDALRGDAEAVPLALLLDLAAPGGPRARRAAGLALIRGRREPESLLAALRLVDDPDVRVRAMARERAVGGLRNRLGATGPYAAEIRFLRERHAPRLPSWLREMRERAAARRDARR